MYSERLKYLREEKELTQKDLADILKIERGPYSLYESEYTIIPLKHLITLCNFFNVSLDYIFNFKTTKQYKNINYEVDNKKSGQRLKEFRKSNKLTQKNLADILNVARSIIGEYENGFFLISTHSLYTICNKYNISADYLLGRTN